MHPHWSLLLSLLLLLLAANALPALLGLLLGPATPIDGGHRWSDGRPLLGPSKTWRGLAAALLATTLAGLALGIPWHLGLLVAGGAMAGDLAASFIKRRWGLPPSASMPLLDPLPESLLPLLLVKDTLGLAWADLAMVALAFAALDLLLTPVGRHLSSRRS